MHELCLSANIALLKPSKIQVYEKCGGFSVISNGIVSLLYSLEYNREEGRVESTLSGFRYLKANRKYSLETLSRLWWPRVGIKPLEVCPKQTYCRAYACNLTFLNEVTHPC